MELPLLTLSYNSLDGTWSLWHEALVVSGTSAIIRAKMSEELNEDGLFCQLDGIWNEEGLLNHYEDRIYLELKFCKSGCSHKILEACRRFGRKMAIQFHISFETQQELRKAIAIDEPVCRICQRLKTQCMGLCYPLLDGDIDEDREIQNGDRKYCNS